MSKKRTARQRKQRKPNTREKNPEHAPLIPVDQTPFLKKAVTRCRRLRTELNKKQAQLQKFEDEDIAAHSQWLHANFGPELTHIRDLEEEREELNFILHQLKMCELFAPEHFLDVYNELMQRKKAGTLFEFTPPAPDDAEADEDSEEEEDEGYEEDPFDEMFDAIFDDLESDMEDDEAEDMRDFFGFPKKHPSPHKHQAPEKRAQLKSLYRKLAKRLHPDVSPLESSQRDKRWQELQNAYHDGDLEALQRVEAVCDMDEGGISQKLGLARLNELIDYHQSHLYPIREALKEAKHHPAFIFVQKGPEALRTGTIRELEHMKEHLESQNDWTQRAIHMIKDSFTPSVAPPRKQTRKSARKSQTNRKKQDPEFDPRQMGLF